jgi:hypothetical protein
MTEGDDTMTIDAQLRAVDEALASGTATSPDALERELQDLTLALRAETPEPSFEFEGELRSRVREGFPRKGRLRWPHPVRLRIPAVRRPPLPVLGGVATVLVALAVAFSLQGGDEAGPTLSGQARAPSSGESGATSSPRALDSPAPSIAPQPPIAPEPPDGRGGFAPGERERRVERSASLTLAARGDRLDRVADGIVRLTDRHDGFVLRSSLSTGDDGTTGGDFELRIPSARLQAALGALSKLADVRAQSQSGEDVTPEFVSAAERLEAARAERRSLLRRLERAPNDSAAESIRRRLDLNAGEIRGLRGQVRDLRTRTNYASVTVTLQTDGGGGASSPGSRDGLGGAVDDALESLSDSVEIAIRLLGVILPLALLAGALTLAARGVRRRRREAALG